MNDAKDEVGFRRSPGWALVLTAILVGQGWLTLQLFAPGLPLARLTSDEPILNGRHPLHLYHGQLGYRVWHDRQAASCFDPAFQAGYLKTPIFDAGSRPSELFQLIGGPGPRSYKVGLAVCCLIAPLAFALAGRGVGLGGAGSCLVGAIGAVLWWSPPSRALLDHGDLDLLVAGVCVPVHLLWLARFRRSPGPVEWLVIAGSAAVIWYMHPLLMAGLVPLTLLYQLWLFRGVRLAWHMAVGGAHLIAFGVNSFWLTDWFAHVWLYVPYGGDEAPRTHWPTAFEEWEAFLPNDPVDLGVCAIGLLGLAVMAVRHRTAACLSTLGAATFFAAGGLGRLWPAAAEIGAHNLTAVGIWVLAVPGAYALAAVARGIGNASGFRPLGVVWLAVGLAGATFALDLPARLRFEPLTIGLGADREDIVRLIRERSTTDGRVLWEDRNDGTDGAGWSALLPDLTHRHFLGGISPDVAIDHLHARMADGKLLGRPIHEWSDPDLVRFFDRYNVTRVVARTPEAIERFRRFKGAAAIADFRNDRGVFFAIDRRATYVLRGEAVVTQMDWKRVALADLVPDENGAVVLSLHHHTGWQVSPGYVTVERDVDVADPVPMVRLRLSGPVARATMTWKGEE